jgi:hypothetical protein
MTAIGTYNYTYGSGNQPNRQVQFFRPGAAKTIYAEVYVLNSRGEPGTQISRVNKIFVGESVPKSLQEHLKVQQDAIMQSLAGREIKATNDTGIGIGGNEVITQLDIC